MEARLKKNNFPYLHGVNKYEFEWHFYVTVYFCHYNGASLTPTSLKHN